MACQVIVKNTFLDIACDEPEGPKRSNSIPPEWRPSYHRRFPKITLSDDSASSPASSDSEAAAGNKHRAESPKSDGSTTASDSEDVPVMTGKVAPIKTVAAPLPQCPRFELPKDSLVRLMNALDLSVAAPPRKKRVACTTEGRSSEDVDIQLRHLRLAKLLPDSKVQSAPPTAGSVAKEANRRMPKTKSSRSRPDQVSKTIAPHVKAHPAAASSSSAAPVASPIVVPPPTQVPAVVPVVVSPVVVPPPTIVQVVPVVVPPRQQAWADVDLWEAPQVRFNGGALRTPLKSSAQVFVPTMQ